MRDGALRLQTGARELDGYRPALRKLGSSRLQEVELVDSKLERRGTWGYRLRRRDLVGSSL